jgi:hypothetical protein
MAQDLPAAPTGAQSLAAAGDSTQFQVSPAAKQQAIQDLTALLGRLTAVLDQVATEPPQPGWFSQVGSSAGQAFLAKHQDILAQGRQLQAKITAQRDALQSSHDLYVAADVAAGQDFAAMTTDFQNWSMSASSAVSWTASA